MDKTFLMNTLISKYRPILKEYFTKGKGGLVSFVTVAATITIWVSDTPGVISSIILTLFYCLFGIFHFYLITSSTFARFVNKIWPLHPFCPKWDAKVCNWLCQDDLGIKAPMYYSLGFGNSLCSIDTPIGTIWVANFPHAFGSEYNRDNPNKIFVPSLKVQKKLKMKIEELFDVFYNEESAKFERKSSMYV